MTVDQCETGPSSCPAYLKTTPGENMTSATSTQQSTCPDGSTPAADGSCPPPPISNPTQPCIDNPAIGSTCPSSPQQIW